MSDFTSNFWSVYVAGITIAGIIVCLLLLWVVAGVAMTMKWIPYYDLGYSWFNTHIFQLF